MLRSRTVSGVIISVGLFVVLVTPASGWFQSGGILTRGIVTSAPITYGDEEAAATCEKTEGGWIIQEATKNEATTLGQDLLVSVSKWNNCSAFGFVGGTSKPCQLEEVQKLKGQTVGILVNVVTECIVKITGQCEIKIPASALNRGLKEVKLANSGANLVDTFNVSGVTSTATPLGGFGCPGVTNLTNKVGTIKAVITKVGVKEV